MSKYTKGPWRVTYSESDGFRIQQKNLCFVADVYGGRDPESNAQLIAAAPDLYAICLKIQKLSEEKLTMEEGVALEKAIAKAEGREK